MNWVLFVGWSLSPPARQSAHVLVQLFIGNSLFHQNLSTLRSGGGKAPANEQNPINKSINNGVGGAAVRNRGAR